MPITEDQISNGQRALWTFLFFMLVMPFFGALAAAVLLLVGIMIGQAPGFLADMPLPEAYAQIAPLGITAFVWNVIPSAMTAIAILPTVLKRGTLGSFTAGACGVIAFTAAILLFPFPTGVWQPLLAFVAGLVAVACQQLLKRIGVLGTDVQR